MDAYMPLWIKEDIWKWLREVMKKFDAYMDAYMPLWIKEDIWKWLREVMKKFDFFLPIVAV
jgi:23S rRNA G2069 N7-methylase RlmK/C1962 C5-methylase RlmI